MANEIRLRRNNIAGTITDNPLTNVATTINSPGFVDLPTVDATNHLILILDPLETAGPAEIVRVTAHTAAATVVTVTRGAEGSAARTHSLGTTWFHGPVTTDWTEVLTSGTRPTVPYTGELLYETDTVRYSAYDGTTWRRQDAGGVLGYAQITANQTGIATPTDITGLSLTFTYPANRRIKVTGYATHQNSVAPALMALYVNEGATTLQKCFIISGAVNTDETLQVEAILTPTAGVHTYKLVSDRAAGTNQVSANALNPAFILIEDIGSAL